MPKNVAIKKIISFIITICFSISSIIIYPSRSTAQNVLPSAGNILSLSTPTMPVVLKGIRATAENPFQLDFLVDAGDLNSSSDETIKINAQKSIKYFLAALTIPDKDQWVNLSPYEKDRIVPDNFGNTEMGRDLLAQDFVLKKLTASLMYPETELGREFWKKIYDQAYEKFGTTDIPTDTFNKVWIVPSKAVVYEGSEGAFITEEKLDVMLEQDYIAQQHGRSNTLAEPQNNTKQPTPETQTLIKTIILPALLKEVNEGKHFEPLRQIYHAMILATWFKRNLKESLLGQSYVEKNKIIGIDIADKNERQKIYAQYIEVFKKGMYDYIKDEYDPVIQKIIPRKYFSGGFSPDQLNAIFTQKREEPFAFAGKKRLRAIHLNLTTTNNSELKPGSDNALLASSITEKVQNVINALAQPQKQPQKFLTINGQQIIPIPRIQSWQPNEIYDIGNGLVVRVRSAQFDSLMSSKHGINTNYQKAADIAVSPSFFNSGEIRTETGKIYPYIITEKINGQNLNTYYFKHLAMATPSNAEQDKAWLKEKLKILIKRMIKNKLLLSDFRPDQFMLGYSELNEKQQKNIWLIDPDLLEEFPELSYQQLIELYKLKIYEDDSSVWNQLYEYRKMFLEILNEIEKESDTAMLNSINGGDKIALEDIDGTKMEDGFLLLKNGTKLPLSQYEGMSNYIFVNSYFVVRVIKSNDSKMYENYEEVAKYGICPQILRKGKIFGKNGEELKYIAVELIDGNNLAEMKNSLTDLQIKDLRKILRELIKRKIIIRDFWPEQFMVGKNIGRTKSIKEVWLIDPEKFKIYENLSSQEIIIKMIKQIENDGMMWGNSPYRKVFLKELNTFLESAAAENDRAILTKSQTNRDDLGGIDMGSDRLNLEKQGPGSAAKTSGKFSQKIDYNFQGLSILNITIASKVDISMFLGLPASN
ncbi:MAG: hypothetical protein HQL25_05490 [Candidatus Omnitrophica bacterium]|nr:hypothetical protein [Candidatus Omnitrophota bacterium]